jgi:eukaryotic-like serine/threonine-protein kinase
VQPSSQPVLVSVDLPRPGEELGSYVIERQLGQGGMAVVYEARHRVLGKRVALKMLLPHHAACAELAQRFQREGEAAALLDHPNAVSVLDGGCDERGTPFLVLEYLEGEDLGTVLSRERRLGVQHTVDLLVPMIAAIAAAHDLGIVHRDLKPENLFLARRQRQVIPKVLDFGISKTNAAESLKLTRSESLLGTPHYMSPEQAQGASHADARTDQFAIGVMLYECVTGQCPFEGNSLFAVLAAIVGGTLTPPSALVDGLDPGFEATVTRALSKEPEDRFPDLRALGMALLPLASERIRLGYAQELSGVELALPPALERAENTRPTVVHAETNPGVSAAPSLPPEMMHSVRTPVLVGSAIVLAAVAGLGVASLDDDPRATTPDEANRVGATRSAKPTPAAVEQSPTAAEPRSSNNIGADEQLTANIEPPRKPSGLFFEAVDAPSLCVSADED